MKNKELFDVEKIEEIKNYLVDTLRGYVNATNTYRDEQEKWNRAYNCTYNQGDHLAKTDSKIFDSETHDAIDTLSKRICTAMFSNKNITKLEYADYVDEDIKKQVDAFWDLCIKKLNLRKRLEPILKSGIINGTYISRINPEVTSKTVLKTIRNGDGTKTRYKDVIQDTMPVIDFINILDIIVDPTIPYIEDVPVVAYKKIIPNKDILENSDDYIIENVSYYERKNSDAKNGGIIDDEEKKKRVLWDSGVDYDQLRLEDMRLVYEVYFKYSEDDEPESIYYAILDASTGEIIRIEDNPFDDGMVPYVSGQYISRNNLFYGIGAPEQAWQIQVMLNNIFNQYLDNIDICNGLNILCPEGGNVSANNVVNIGRFKFIPVLNPAQIVQLKNTALPDISVMVNDLRGQIQKKTKATMTLQGLPLQGNRTATEAVGVREEVNLSIKDLIINAVSCFVEPLLNKWKDAICQFNEDDKLELKIPVNEDGTKFDIVEVSFEDIRPLLKEAKVKVVSVDEQETKLMKIAELKELVGMAMQAPNLINLPYVMKKLYFDMLGFEDYDNMTQFVIPSNTPVTVERENQILGSGNPINTNEMDNHEEHMLAHQQLFDGLVAEINNPNSPNINNPSMINVFRKALMNITNHLEEHQMEYQKMQMMMKEQQMMQEAHNAQ